MNDKSRTATTRCPNCAAGMKPYALSGHYGATVDIDACHDCNALWFDAGESAQLSPDGVVDLFKMVHESGGAAASKIGEGLGCVRCRKTLKPAQDIVSSSRFNYLNCGDGHGRLITFYQFLVEKKFVRELTAAERSKLAAEVKQVKCSGCGAAVNLAKDSACGYCRAPVSVFDRNAAQKAIEHYLNERGKQLPATPQTASRGSNTNYSGGSYDLGDLSADAVWAMAHFAARGRPWRSGGGGSSVASGAISDNGTNLFADALPSAGASLPTLATADEMLGNSSDTIATFASAAAGETSLLSAATATISELASNGLGSIDGNGFTDAASESVSEATASILSSDAIASGTEVLADAASSIADSDGLLDLVGDGIGSLLGSIFD